MDNTVRVVVLQSLPLIVNKKTHPILLKQVDCSEIHLSFSAPVSQVAAHDWIRTDGNSSKCQVCHKKIKTLAGRRCVWCQEMVRTVCFCRHLKNALEIILEDVHSVLSLLKRHEECLFSGLSSCDCGPLRDHILPPWAIYAASKVQLSQILTP